MKNWLLHLYRASIINKYLHQDLPMMIWETLRILIGPDAARMVAFTDGSIPVHLRDKVKAKLHEEVQMGVI